MKSSFATLRAAYPRKSVRRAELYAEIGIEELIDVDAYKNTCGIRMSYAFTRAGMPLQRGGLRINKGPYKGARIEASMGKLAVLFATAANLIASLTRSHAEGRLEEKLKFYTPPRLLIINEIGYLPNR